MYDKHERENIFNGFYFNFFTNSKKLNKTKKCMLQCYFLLNWYGVTMHSY